MVLKQSFLLVSVILLPFLSRVYCDDYNVIIVGAGAAGIAAATRLVDNGVTNVLLFEAECRYGGRIHSVKFGDGFVDLGAQWVHGEKNNTVYEMVKKYDILRHTNFEEVKYVYSTGEEIEAELASAIQNFTREFADSSPLVTRNVSLGELFINQYDTDILGRYRSVKDRDKLKVAVDAISSVTAQLLSLEGAFDLNDVSASSKYEHCEGDQNLNWDGMGYQTILDVMMRTYPNNLKELPIRDRLFVNKPVSRIRWKGLHNLAKVYCQDGSSYVAHHVIFTPSLGVLKLKYRSMFEPELPGSKQQVINQLGFDAVMKIVLRFPDKWWTGDFLPTSLIWSAEDKVNLATMFPYGPIKDGESWLSSIRQILPVENNPKVLIAWATGPFIPSIELTGDDIVKDGIKMLLERFFAKYNVFEPEEIIRSTWYTNLNFHGTYTYEPVGMNVAFSDPHEELAKPLGENGKPILLFAGEATHSIHYGTVHGAIETGYREADRILKYHGSL